MGKRKSNGVGVTQALVRMYRRHEEWALRSGYAPMEWVDFKASRLKNPLSRPRGVAGPAPVPAQDL